VKSILRVILISQGQAGLRFHADHLVMEICRIDPLFMKLHRNVMQYVLEMGAVANHEDPHDPHLDSQDSLKEFVPLVFWSDLFIGWWS
jgi:hypothetical protein